MTDVDIRHISYGLLVATVLTIAVIFIGSAEAGTQPRWEYKILHHNRFGEEFKDQAVLEGGWEPVNYTARPGYGSALLIRRRVP